MDAIQTMERTRKDKALKVGQADQTLKHGHRRASGPSSETERLITDI